MDNPFDIDLKISNLKDNINKSKINIKRLTKQKSLSNESLNKGFRRKHKKLFLCFDILMFLIILSNLGALLITNAMVMKDYSDDIEIETLSNETLDNNVIKQKPTKPKIEFREVNPVTAERNQFKVHPQAKLILTQFMFFVIFWSLGILFYIFLKNNASDQFGIHLILILLVFMGYALFSDFVNDLGYYIGSKLF